MTKKIATKGKLFIIPVNPVIRETPFNSLLDESKVRVKNLFQLEPAPDSRWLQVRATNSHYSDWSHNLTPWEDELLLDISPDWTFPVHLPEELLVGKMEGDVLDIRFTIPEVGAEVTIELTLQQARFRYARYGAFHEVLATLLNIE